MVGADTITAVAAVAAAVAEAAVAVAVVAAQAAAEAVAAAYIDYFLTSSHFCHVFLVDAIEVCAGLTSNYVSQWSQRS